MNPLKRLAGQTAIYGLPSIVGRLLNYLLVPLHTGIFALESYGTITEFYAYVSFLVVILTYGMETAFFRYSTRQHDEKPRVYSTVMLSLISSSFAFVFLASYFAPSIASFLKYPENDEYIIWFAFIVGLDAISSIPLARLRIENKALRFAGINFASILINIGLNAFWIAYCIPNADFVESHPILQHLYVDGVGVGYVFLANLFATLAKFLMLSPELFKIKLDYSTKLMKQLLIYSSPLLISSLAIIVNENADKIMLKWILAPIIGAEAATAQLGIYGACYKLSIIISLFIQAFRYAAEPFFFSQADEKDSRLIYAKVMKYFIIICSLIFLAVMLYIDIVKEFLRKDEYHEGLDVVPILLFANIFLGVFYNLSIWYKLADKTKYAAMIAGFGAILTIVLNFWLIPIFSYMGSAWTTLICYASMVVISYILGQKHFKINYPLKRIFLYMGMALMFYAFSIWLSLPFGLLQFTLHTGLLLVFLTIVVILEYPKKVLIS